MSLREILTIKISWQSLPYKKEFMNNYYVYILSNKTNSTIYVGVTNDLIRRLDEHKNNVADGFTKRYSVHKLVYYETTTDINSAIEREKQIKSWNRKRKENLINSINPNWDDLSEKFE